MSFLRPFARVTAQAPLRPRIPLPSLYATTSSPFSTRSNLRANSSYGGGDGDPKGENPQQQGTQKNSDLEHPGPPPPDVGKGTGGGPTKATSHGHEGADGSSSKKSASTSGSQDSNGNASPKIHHPEDPSKTSAAPEDVKRHNEEFEKRHDRSAGRAKDEEKVDAKFWAGTGGVDRQP